MGTYSGPVKRERSRKAFFDDLVGASVVHQSRTVTGDGIEESGLAVRPEYEGRRRGIIVKGALQDRYCPELADERPIWLPDGLCSEE